MLQGIIVYLNRLPRPVFNFFHFIPVLLTAIYLVIVTAILLPLAVAVCVVFIPLLYVLWRAKQHRFNSTFLRIMYPFELIGLTIVNSPQIAANMAARTRKMKRPALRIPAMSTSKMKSSKAMLIGLKILALLGVAGVAIYLVAVAAVVLPLALGSALVLAPFCYLLWYVKEKKFIPLFQKIPGYLENLGLTIVNSRKIMTNFMGSFKNFNFRWPMF